MSKTEKLVIGKPYSIIVRDGNRVMKICGDALTPEDVRYYIESGILSKDDILAQEKKASLYPSFEDIVSRIDQKFFPWEYFTYNLYNKYPTAAQSIILKEYSKIACSKIKSKNEVYLIKTSDGTIIPMDISKDLVVTYACFPTPESAKEAYDSMMKGVSNFI